MALPKIPYDNIFASGVTATDTDSDSQYSVDNIYDLRTYTYWKAASIGTKYIYKSLPNMAPSGCVGSWLVDTDDTNVVGSELILNGGFPTNTDNWNDSNDAILSVDTQRLKVTNGAAANGWAHQVVTTVIGKTYTVRADGTLGTSGAVRLFIGTTNGSTNLGSITHDYSGVLSLTFVATTTTVYIQLQAGSSVSGETALYDDVRMRLADRDHSGNNNGLQVFGTITKTLVATDAEIVDYSGFTTNNYLEQPYNSDLDFGTGDFYVMGWIKEGANSAVEMILERAYYDGSYSGGGIIRAFVEPAGSIRFRISDDDMATNDTIVSTNAIDNSVRTLVTFVRRGSNIELWFGDTKAASDVAITNAAGSLSNTSATLQLGTYQSGQSPLANGSLALWRMGAGTLTAAQISEIYEAEKKIFDVTKKYITADSLGILSHNLGTANASVFVESSATGDWGGEETTRLSSFTPSDDKALFKTFTNATDLYWRLGITTASVTPYFAVALLGEALEFPIYPDAPFTPKSEGISASTSKTKAASILGSVVDHHPLSFRVSFDYPPFSFLDGDFKTFWDDHGKQLKPFLWVPNLDDLPNDIYWVKFPDRMKLAIPRKNTSNADRLLLTFEGVSE